jgi:hypothetical protein
MIERTMNRVQPGRSLPFTWQPNVVRIFRYWVYDRLARTAPNNSHDAIDRKEPCQLHQCEPR